MSMKIRDVFKFTPMKLYAAEIDAMMEKDFFKDIQCTHPVLDKANLVGIEVEVEQVPIHIGLNPLWSRVEDGSLRHDGWEYVSAPIKGEVIEKAVRGLYKQLFQYNNHPTFSKRCGLHVHINARTMSCEQTLAMIYLYLVFEKTLFRFAGEGREDNYNCVPLRQCQLMESVGELLHGRLPVNAVWMKYSALNLLPLSGKGTLEFRHMPGTPDPDRVLTWINLLTSIKLFCYKRSLEDVVGMISALNTNSEYVGFSSFVFGDYVKQLQIVASDLEEGVAQVKLYSSGSTYLRDVYPQRKMTIPKIEDPFIKQANFANAVWENPTAFINQYVQVGVPAGDFTVTHA